MKKNKKIRENISTNLHVALRKVCDSKPTSIIWNVFSIALDYNGQNPNFIKYFDDLPIFLIENYENINGLKTLADYVKKFTLKFDFDGYLGNIASCAFELFEEDDWLGYCIYLADDVFGYGKWKSVK